jgi:hypothetical protein
LLGKVGKKALDAKESITIIEIISAIVENDQVDMVDSIVIPGIRYFTEIGDTQWVDAIVFMPDLPDFVRKLSEGRCEVVLENLVLCHRIDYHQELILVSISEYFPRIVWSFFKNRLDYKSEVDYHENYETVPYGFQELQKPLSRDVELAVDTVRSWYRADKSLFQYRGGKMLHNVFPNFSAELEANLIRIVREKTDEDIDFVLQILSPYNGEVFLHKICKEIVDSAPENDGYLRKIEVILENTDNVSGQFGLVEAYQRKKEEAKSWMDDNRPRVRAFGERYQRSLERAIAAEQRRSEADYELRRRDWPEDDEE